MEVEYLEAGPEGRTCADCINFRHLPDNPDQGICFGREVCASGSCNFFKPRK